MSKSKFEYVKRFEAHAQCLPETFILVRVDGKGFSKFTAVNAFEKPNDARGLRLMALAAEEVCRAFKDVFLAYGQSDEFSFMMDRGAGLYSRRKEKICSTVASLFTAAYVSRFAEAMQRPMVGLALFDARVVEYPTARSMRDYFRWRQVDCHINNLYNTCFWALVRRKKLSQKKAEEVLRDTVSADKHELLFSEFGVNYSSEPEVFRKGTLLVRTRRADPRKLARFEALRAEGQAEKLSPPREKLAWERKHCDLIQPQFWAEHFAQVQ